MKSLKSIWIIMHKELRRVFRSPSMFIALISPGILLFAMYSFLGMSTPASDAERAQETTFIVYAINMPEAISDVLADTEFDYAIELRDLDITALETRIQQIKDEEIHLILIFSENFEDIVSGVVVTPEIPSLQAFFNPAYAMSRYALNELFLPELENFRNDIIGIDPDEIFTVSSVPTADERRVIGGFLAEMIPMMLVIFLFTACMTITAESIAGEKERGTISTLLATPAKRASIATGKIVALSIIAMVSAVSSFIGLMFGLPQLFNMPVFSMYGFGEWALIFFILAATVLFIVGMMALISSFAKNVKEATLWISILMFIGMGISLLPTVIGVGTNIALYFIPLYNTVLALASVISFDVIIINLAITFVTNILYSLGLVWVLAKVFNNEKIMFSK